MSAMSIGDRVYSHRPTKWPDDPALCPALAPAPAPGPDNLAREDGERKGWMKRGEVDRGDLESVSGYGERRGDVGRESFLREDVVSC